MAEAPAALRCGLRKVEEKITDAPLPALGYFAKLFRCDISNSGFSHLSFRVQQAAIMKLTQTVISTVLLAASAVAATEGAYYGGNYYELHPNLDGGAWAEAKADAADRSHCGVKGHLAKITSQGENDFIVGLGEVDDVAGVWIGLNDIASEGERVWHDDDALCPYNAWDVVVVTVTIIFAFVAVFAVGYCYTVHHDVESVTGAGAGEDPPENTTKGGCDPSLY